MLSVLHSMLADALASLGARASAGMILTPKPKYSISSIRRVNIMADHMYPITLAFKPVHMVQWFRVSSHDYTIPHFNTLRLRHNGRHFADDTFKCILVNKNVWISNEISLKYVPWGRIDNNPASVQIMAWCRTGNKPLSEPMMVLFIDAYMSHSASMGQPWIGWLLFEKI